MRNGLMIVVSMLALAALCFAPGDALSDSERTAAAILLTLFIVGLLTRVARRPRALNSRD